MPRLLPRLPFLLACVVALAFSATIGAAPAAGIGHNLLANPDFDSDISPWKATRAAQPDAEDADGCARSGSLLTGTSFGGDVVDVYQCVPVTSLEAYILGLRARTVSATTTVTGSMFFVAYSSSDCSGILLSSFGTGNVAVGAGWTSIRMTSAAFDPDAQGFLIIARFESSFAFSVKVDRTFFGSGDEIFFDDHEIGQLCRYSAKLP